MEIINGKSLSELCDYSFGDHLGGLDPDKLPGGFMKFANSSNTEFLDACKQFEGRVMSLFIDNIRLYNRPLWVNAGPDAQWVEYLLQNNDLLALCSSLPKNKFVIFTSHEDTPIDRFIRLPENVLGVHAVNAIYNDEKVFPFPYGLQRPIGQDDKRLHIMQARVDESRNTPVSDMPPTKLLYINCGLGKERNAPERAYLPEFEKYPWATCRFDKNSKFFPYDKYADFLDEMQDHKFMICPQGHGIDCHRNWELLYMRRVPVMKECQYFERLMKPWPVLFVKDWSEITEELLKENEHLYQRAQTMDLSTLDLKKMFSTIMQSYINK